MSPMTTKEREELKSRMAVHLGIPLDAFFSKGPLATPFEAHNMMVYQEPPVGQLVLELFNRVPDPSLSPGDVNDATRCLFGPFESVVFTYATTLKLITKSFTHFFDVLESGHLYYDGYYYADWSLFVMSNTHTQGQLDWERLETWRPEKADPYNPRNPDRRGDVLLSTED